ncbi:P-loop containing nucleoside triphosphate hydrolase protein [Ephemerocybe angulata]|uniref:P-loop containing nucleoside triphosphate hydrolase protein n=1 Tax=Ephemerocybe angulata TaxID=980116 RepID=A0A8H6HTI9_9AGAR|nr:P-loop containing nucleoside triphosphate hydrolase protein [Tulosesus angulatus]
MQSSTANLRNTFSNLMDEDCETKKRIGKLQSLYSAKEIKNVMEDGELDYPHEKSHPEGMSFELSDVNFSYPTTQKKESSLSSVNLKIHSGSVVVIVGSNGSGKSTLIRLLSRLYEPTSWTYRTTSLRESSILLSQDHNIFPMDSAEKGGAKEFIEKLDKGFDTIIHPMVAIAANKLEHQPDHPLQEEKKKISKKSNISGGEQQRVVAARAFMRMNSGKIRFVAVDEPTSALDSEGELQLFTRLLEAREGKTMVFVTHRFGYLTKHADMIVCMKNGTVEEVGTHSELYANKTGEYTKLYNIQANAFLADS